MLCHRLLVNCRQENESIQPLLVKEGKQEDPLDFVSTLDSYIQKQVRRGGPLLLEMSGK